jgi:hypothetical protein
MTRPITLSHRLMNYKYIVYAPADAADRGGTIAPPRLYT